MLVRWKSSDSNKSSFQPALGWPPPRSRPCRRGQLRQGCQRFGLASFVYDPATFGAVDCAPRHAINPWPQARGYRNALAHARGTDHPAATTLTSRGWGECEETTVTWMVHNELTGRLHLLLMNRPHRRARR